MERVMGGTGGGGGGGFEGTAVCVLERKGEGGGMYRIVFGEGGEVHFCPRVLLKQNSVL